MDGYRVISWAAGKRREIKSRLDDARLVASELPDADIDPAGPDASEASAALTAWHSEEEPSAIVPKTVLYESFDGNGALCNPEAIFRGLMADPEFADFHHIWVLAHEDQYAETLEEFEHLTNVEFVQYKSAEYEHALKSSQYLINNSTFSPQFNKAAAQTYLNTWHGTPLKKMGHDTPGGAVSARNTIRNFLSADYLLSSSPYMTERLYLDAYGLRNIYQGTIIEEGTPRIDHQFLSDVDREELALTLESRGIETDDDRKIIVYAPTWRGDSFNSPEDDSFVLKERVRSLNAMIDSTKYHVLLKIHQRAYNVAVKDPDLAGMLIPNDIPTNSVLGLCDVLITDYSSIFFDYLASEKPILFFVPDLEQYTSERGLYFEPSDWPGPSSRSLRQLAEHINRLGDGSPADPLESHRDAYAAAKEQFTPFEDGKATSRIIDIVFRGRGDAYRAVTKPSDGRETMLVYMGGMRSNGITTSALNLVDAIDHDRFDVTAFYGHSNEPDCRKNAAALSPRVRPMPRVGKMDAETTDKATLDAAYRGADLTPEEQARVDALMRAEWRRMFGSARFDYVIDFSGYSAFWPLQLLQSPPAKRTIWMHNDLAADARREIDGKRPHEDSLNGVFSLYERFDRLVSVSPQLASINQARLSAHAAPEKFLHAVNTINYRRILEMAYGDDHVDRRSESAQVDGPRESIDITVAPASPSGALDALLPHFTLEQLQSEVDRRLAVQNVLPPAPGVTTFVTVGRLSPEKNHRRLLRAFKVLHDKNPATRLVIVGDGPSSKWLHKLVRNYDLEGSVIMAGQQNNPYAIMAQCDCFVLSSDYEGQPMVILEARVLGLPVISTNFASVGGALPPGVGLTVPMRVNRLAQAMARALEGTIPNPPFDYKAYNQEAIGQFYAAVGASGAC